MRNHLNNSLFLIFVIAFMLPLFATAQGLELPSMFGHHMVLQRNQPIPIWGKAAPEIEVIVRFDEEKFKTTSDKDGNWKIELPKQEAGGPHKLKITARESRTFKDVMIGDVWLCSGQSNMNMPINGWGRVNNYEEEVKNANYENIRLFQAKTNYKLEPQWDVPSSGWQVCSSETISEFSAVAYFFGRKIFQETNIPIGLLHSSSGGTPVEAWMSEEALSKYSSFAERLKEVKEATPESDAKIEKDYRQAKKDWLAWADQNDLGLIYKYYNQSVAKTKSWSEMELPQYWEEQEGMEELDGIVWFRKVLRLPKVSHKKAWTIDFGPTDDYDELFINGKRIGFFKSKNAPTIYELPVGSLKSGVNKIDLRVIDVSKKGGVWGKADEMRLVSEDGEQIPLAGTWKYKVGLVLTEENKAPVEKKLKKRSTVLFNGMIHPLIPYGIKGAIWYQGESNSSYAYFYRELFPAMIKDWREHWNIGDFPFLFVQLPNFLKSKAKPARSKWAELRESQSKALDLPNTYMAVTLGLGDSLDIHPKNKQDVGLRLALLAQKNIYAQDVICSGPVYDDYDKENGKIIISFKGINGQLKTEDGASVKGFAIAGRNKKFYWAKAEIVGNSVVVSSAKVKSPVAVRYAWAEQPKTNLTDDSGLPAAPFRTDAWKLYTEGRE